MKPIFGIDITENKKNTVINGNEFIIATTSAENAAELENAGNEVEELLEKAKIPLWARIIHGACGFVGALLFFSILRGTADVGIETGYRNAPYLFWICGITLVVWGIFSLWSRRRQNKTMKTDDANETLSDLTENQNNAYEELGVPQDAVNMDILLFHYKMKNGEPVAKAKGLAPSEYINLEVKAYVKDGQLCLADTESVYAFPLEEMTGIRTVRKRISVPSWNKSELPTKGIYKPYKLTVANTGYIFFRPYYILEFNHYGTPCGIYFPSYELPTVERLTGLHAGE